LSYTKFGFQIEIDILKRGTTANPTPEVKLRLSVRHIENRYNIITLPKKSDLDKIRQPGAERHLQYSDAVEIETGSKISRWRTFVFPNRK